MQMDIFWIFFEYFLRFIELNLNILGLRCCFSEIWERLFVQIFTLKAFLLILWAWLYFFKLLAPSETVLIIFHPPLANFLQGPPLIGRTKKYAKIERPWAASSRWRVVPDFVQLFSS
jgi:hypothetical protein